MVAFFFALPVFADKTHVNVFVSGTEGYHTFRIPAIETSPDGTLLAFAEARKHNAQDPGYGINGLRIVDYVEPDDDIEQNGFIGLQIHSGPPSEVWYKDIEIKEL